MNLACLSHLRTQNMAVCDRNSITAVWDKGFHLEQLYIGLTPICPLFSPGVSQYVTNKKLRTESYMTKHIKINGQKDRTKKYDC